MTTAEKPLATVVKLPGVRLSFANLIEHEMYEGQDTGKFSATFLIPHGDKKTLKAIDRAIEEAIVAKWPTKRPKDIILTLKDGDDATYEGYEGNMSLKATRKSRPVLLDRDKSALSTDEAEEKLYSGCYVNASVDFNAGTDSYKKNRVWCNLRGVQFLRDGDRFASGTPVNVDEEFDDFSDDDDDPLA